MRYWRLSPRHLRADAERLYRNRKAIVGQSVSGKKVRFELYQKRNRL